MYYLKILCFACAGFALPVVVAANSGPRFFPGAMSVRRSAVSDAELSPAALNEPERLNPTVESSGAFQTVPADLSLDPVPGKYFIVSLQVKLGSLPRVGKRQRLAAKYSNRDVPYPGWAIAVRRLSTSTRPEVYWQNKEGKGGWYTFENMRFSKRRWYNLTLIARDQDLLSLYAEELEEDGTSADEADDDGEAEDTNTLSAQGVRFLGGYNLSEVRLVPTDAPVEVAPRSGDSSGFRGELRNFLIAQPERLPPKQVKLMEFVTGGVAEIAGRLEAEEIGLWIDDEGKDRSSAQRAVSLVPGRS